jgi:Bacterial PH domain
VTQQSDIIPTGLPDHLPEGEKLVWQGRPDWLRLARDAFHVNKVAIYFAVVIAGQAGLRLASGSDWNEALKAVPVLLGLAIAACGIILVLSFISARTTHYTMTTKRVIMKVGIALPVIINIPYSQVDGVSFALTGGDRGNIVFKLSGGVRLAYLMLWPHARPWQFSKPQPCFRDIPNVEAVATRLAQVIGGHMPSEAPRTADSGGRLVAAE